MLSSLQSDDSGSTFLNRYAAQMGAMARQRRAESAVVDTQKSNEDIAERLYQVIKQTERETDYMLDMSHRLRTLLNAIIGFSALMEKENQGPLEDGYRQYAADIHESGNEILSLLEQFSQSNAGSKNRIDTTPLTAAAPAADEPAPAAKATEPAREPTRSPRPINESVFGIQGAIRDAYAELKERASEKQIKIRARLSRDLPDIRADQNLIKSMLTHLIGVAIDGAAPGAEVEFIASIDENQAVRFAVDASVHDSDMIAKGLAQQHWEWVSEIMERHDGRFGLEGDPKRHFLAVATLPSTRTAPVADPGHPEPSDG